METNLIKEMTEISQKVFKSYETLNEIKEIDIATTPKTEVYAEDKLKLYRYNRETPSTFKTPVLVVYALVNTYKMLDIQPDRSYIKNLLDAGLDVYLIDWGYPSKGDRFLSMDDYVNGYINNCVDFIRKKNRVEKINILSICQGGTLSVIYASLFPNKVKNLVTHVTPIDFSTNDGLLFRWSRDMDFDKLVDANHGLIPGNFLNEGFDMLKPMMKAQKQQTLNHSLDDKDKLMNFLRMEKWISESPDQAGECFRQFMKELYQQNKLIKGELEVGGKKVNLKNLTAPLLNIYATEDHLVPPAATIPLNDYVGSKDKELYSFKGGHIGVFVGSRSQKELAPAVTTWLKKRDS
ncbi:MAG: class III poly(R)-hydroxyalkanoic acid synthase subunit PhaC [Bacteroidota bacterium]|nr:class III poly(R)-hydroxyalkanoic acid synthase subunit PhaC [Bacteroidota bacterium]MDP3146143.1 class III poly(R)-hydroxyalkanoic acid synthase subunit PhaC [Bacteroidota bacterium]MDP3556704.1 class III poly(R)-hydroxyalkanoic acid synthase subunit PhaC [Bacteroidota bacterium]